jgi:hypothetical protein
MDSNQVIQNNYFKEKLKFTSNHKVTDDYMFITQLIFSLSIFCLTWFCFNKNVYKKMINKLSKCC